MPGGLVLRLRPHEKFIVNGVIIENGDRRTRLRVRSQHANILRFRDAIPPEEASTPAKRLYYLAQLAVAGEADAEETKAVLLPALHTLRAAFGDSLCREELDAALAEAEAGRFYYVMRALNRVIPKEEELLGAARSAPRAEAE